MSVLSPSGFFPCRRSPRPVFSGGMAPAGMLAGPALPVIEDGEASPARQGGSIRRTSFSRTLLRGFGIALLGTAFWAGLPWVWPHPTTLTTVQSLEDAKKLRALAISISKSVKHGKMTALEGFQAVMLQAATMSGNSPHRFMDLMNEVCLATVQRADAMAWTFDWAGVPRRQLPGRHPVLFTDTGVSESYRDTTKDQLSLHFWAFVNFGFRAGVLKSFAGNVVHENFHHGQSQEDFRLSNLGIRLGQALERGLLTPERFAQEFPRFLGTDWGFEAPLMFPGLEQWPFFNFLPKAEKPMVQNSAETAVETDATPDETP